MNYKFGLLDPRNLPAAQESNSKVLGENTLGIEVTIPALAALCGLGNIDPQHSEGRDQAAIEVALTASMPAEGAMLVTVRPDLDSIGAMAVFSLRARGHLFGYRRMARIAKVAESDRFARGDWKGVKALPSLDNPWPESAASASDIRELAAIAAAVSDFKLPVLERVHMMERWILTGFEPQNYRTQVEKERLDMIKAIEDGSIKAVAMAGNRIAQVISTHRAAMMVGYSLAPVVVAYNPEFQVQGGPKHGKYTVAQFTPGYVDLKAVFEALSAMEPGWGGSATVGGSPQGISSKLNLDEVASVVLKHWLREEK